MLGGSSRLEIQSLLELPAMDAINFGLGTPDNPFDFELEREEILKRIKAAIEEGKVPPHLLVHETTKTTNSGRQMAPDELTEVEQFDDYVQKLYDTCEWKQVVQLTRDRLARLPPAYNTYSLLIHAEANCGALDLAAKHAKDAYVWDPLMGEAYVMMAKLDCMAMQPDRSEAWLEIASSIPGNEEECGLQMEATRRRIAELRLTVDKVLANVTHLFCLPDFWVRLSKNVEYYRTFASDETRAIVSQVQRDPSSLRQHLRNEKIQWLVSMLDWSSAALTYAPPNEDQLSARNWHKVQAAQTSKLMSLPTDILIDILDYADPPTLGRLPQVCSFWRGLLSNDHRIWKRLYLSQWDAPIIYRVPDWLWIHAYRQRYGLCVTLARIWARRNGDFAPTAPNYDAATRHFMTKFSFITPRFSDSLSLVSDFVYGNVSFNVNSITRFKIGEVESSEPWPALSPEVEAVYGAHASVSSLASRKNAEIAKMAAAKQMPTSAKDDPEESGYLDSYFTQSIIKSNNTEPLIDPCRRTRNKAIPVFSYTGNSSLFESDLINVCYFLLSKTDYGEESQQAAKTLSALSFKNPKISHHLIQLGAIEHFSEFALGDQYGEAADLVATLLLHRHGVAMEAAESLHSACRIFPRLWALNVAQDLKEAQRWAVGLSGVWRGRFFLGVPGYDTPFTEHFLYLHFHPEINFGHYIPKEELADMQADFETNVKVKPEYKFTSAGHVPRSPTWTVEDDIAEEGALFDTDSRTVQEGELRVTGSGLDDFGYYRVFGRLNIAFRTVYFAKRYEFEPTSTQQAYLGGDLGIWGAGGAIKTPSLPCNGVWKWWKDSTDYSIEQLHQMRLEAETNFLDSVKEHKSRQLLRHRLRTNLTRSLFPAATGIIGDQGIDVPAPAPPVPGPMDINALRRGLRWSEVDFPIVDAMVDPLPPPRGPSLVEFTGVETQRPSYPGYLPESMTGMEDDESLIWYDSGIDYGPPLKPILNAEDEKARVAALRRKPVSASVTPSPRLTFNHCDVLARLLGWSNSIFQLEHMSESMFVLASFERDVDTFELPNSLAPTPPIRRFQGESDDTYVRRRLIFHRMLLLAGQQRYAMMLLHQEQARLDAAYLLRQDIPFDDPRKLHITHRWIDDWLRHPVRMYVTDQQELQQLLAAELLNPSRQCFRKQCLNEETELELVRTYVISPRKLRPDEELEELDDEFEDEMDEDDDYDDPTLEAEQNLFDRGDVVKGNADTETVRAAGWFEAGIALLTVSIALVVGIRYLANRNRK